MLVISCLVAGGSVELLVADVGLTIVLSAFLAVGGGKETVVAHGSPELGLGSSGGAGGGGVELIAELLVAHAKGEWWEEAALRGLGASHRLLVSVAGLSSKEIALTLVELFAGRCGGGRHGLGICRLLTGEDFPQIVDCELSAVGTLLLVHLSI